MPLFKVENVLRRNARIPPKYIHWLFLRLQKIAYLVKINCVLEVGTPREDFFQFQACINTVYHLFKFVQL